MAVTVERKGAAMFGPKEYRGPCGVCGREVMVVTAFLSASYLTCNMASELPPHTREELRARWESRR